MAPFGMHPTHPGRVFTCRGKFSVGVQKRLAKAGGKLKDVLKLEQ
jgi:hypothetical protein